MNSIVNLGLIIILLITACNQADKKDNAMARFLGNYDESIQQDSVQKFIIVPMYGCIGCQNEMMMIWSQDQKDNYKLLTSNLRMLDDNYAKWKDLKARVFVDSNGNLDQVPFRFGDFNLVTVRNSKIIDNLPVMPDANRDSIITRFAQKTYH